MTARSGPQPPAEERRSNRDKEAKREQIAALTWIQQTTPEEPRRPRHLRGCARQMRELEHSIREAERILKVKVEYIHRLVVQQDNTVFLCLEDEMRALAAGLAFLNGLRMAYRVKG